MPTYNYECNSCDYSQEEFLSIDKRKDPESVPCPKCGGKVAQVLTGFQNVIDPYRLGRHKPNQDFVDRLKQVKKNNPGSTMKVECGS
jgi:putative FmdB family regulatory protein